MKEKKEIVKRVVGKNKGKNSGENNDLEKIDSDINNLSKPIKSNIGAKNNKKESEKAINKKIEPKNQKNEVKAKKTDSNKNALNKISSNKVSSNKIALNKTSSKQIIKKKVEGNENINKKNEAMDNNIIENKAKEESKKIESSKIEKAMVNKTYTKDKKTEIIFDVSSIAQQAAGVLATANGTTILCTTVVGKHIESDFLPLSVHYIEKYSAANKMPGGYKKRESAPSDSEILITRAIDRCLRSIIAPEFKNEIQVTIQVLSYDGYALEPLAIAAASLSLNLAHVSNKLVAASIISGDNINKAVHKLSLVANHGHFLQAISDKKIIMLEFMGPTTEKSLLKSALKNSLDKIVAMQKDGMKVANEILALQKSVLSKIGYVYDKNKYSFSEFSLAQTKQISEIANTYINDYIEALALKNQLSKRQAIEILEKKFDKQIEHLYENQHEINSKKIEAKHILYKQIEKAFAQRLFDKKRRLDGRKFDEIRPISMLTKFMPKLHGSALFTRGDTQALVSLTIAPYDQSQTIESLSGVHKENFLLHYNFLPYAVMEIGKVGGLSRREIGHGELARKAFLSQLPRMDNSIRIVSEITSSNGSSSMATVCGASLAMFDAGIELKSHVAGISIGLIELDRDQQKISLFSKFKKNYQLLVDISAIEDEFGKMDFKIAGTKDEITAMQLDIKNDGITPEVFEEALELASKQLKKVLAKMHEIIDIPNKMAYCAPIVIKVDPAKVRLVIGKGGSVINEITKEHNVKIDVDKSGKIVVSSNSENANDDIAAAIKHIRDIID